MAENALGPLDLRGTRSSEGRQRRPSRHAGRLAVPGDGCGGRRVALLAAPTSCQREGIPSKMAKNVHDPGGKGAGERERTGA